MRPPLRPLRNLAVVCSARDLFAVAVVGTVVAAWAGIAAGSFSFGVLAACWAMFFGLYLVGSLLASWAALTAEVVFDLPLRLLAGYAVVNTSLLVLAWFSPLGVIANFAVILALAGFLLWGAGERRLSSGNSAGLWCVGLALVATTLWCQDSLRPISDQGEVLVFKPWVDGFYHAVHVRIFGQSHGAGTIEDFRLAGVPARPYHYGIYLLPAFIKQASGIQAYAAFAGILAPVGVFFTGLAAYAFVGSLFGAWPGVVAVGALLLFPDGAQQGMDNPFLSYHWLTQISPSATYGLSLLALAWLFVLKGCMRGSPLQLLAGWALAAILAVYKLHYVIASALLLLVIPAVFFKGELGRIKRALWGLAACAIYAVAIFFGRRVPGVPLIRFDGSSAGEILRLVLSFAEPGRLRDYAVAHMGTPFPLWANLLYGIPYVLVGALGLALPVLLGLIFLVRKYTTPLLRVFPLLLIANFLAMFFGLALDLQSSTPDELSHRPIMIVYFFAMTWMGGALGTAFMAKARGRGLARAALVVATLLLAVPAILGRGVQKMWAMPQLSPLRVPAALRLVADHIRTHGDRQDLVQHSQFDRVYALAALSERRAFVSHTLTRMTFREEMIDARTSAVENWMKMRQAKLVIATAKAFDIRWFVLERGDPIDWPEEIANHPVLEAGPFRLFEFR